MAASSVKFGTFSASAAGASAPTPPLGIGSAPSGASQPASSGSLLSRLLSLKKAAVDLIRASSLLCRGRSFSKPASAAASAAAAASAVVSPSFPHARAATSHNQQNGKHAGSSLIWCPPSRSSRSRKVAPEPTHETLPAGGDSSATLPREESSRMEWRNEKARLGLKRRLAAIRGVQWVWGLLAHKTAWRRDGGEQKRGDCEEEAMEGEVNELRGGRVSSACCEEVSAAADEEPLTGVHDEEGCELRSKEEGQSSLEHFSLPCILMMPATAIAAAREEQLPADGEARLADGNERAADGEERVADGENVLNAAHGDDIAKEEVIGSAAAVESVAKDLPYAQSGDALLDQRLVAVDKTQRTTEEWEEETALQEAKQLFGFVVQQMKAKFAVRSAAMVVRGGESSDASTGIVCDPEASSSGSSAASADFWKSDDEEEGGNVHDEKSSKLLLIEEVKEALLGEFSFEEGWVLPSRVRMMKSVRSEFSLGEELGRGGQGVVFKAQCNATGEDVAIKVIDKKLLAASGVKVCLVRQEVKAMLVMKGHPNVVDLIALHETANHVYIITEICTGGDLYAWLDTKAESFSPKEFLLSFAGVMDALALSHERGIAHRDVKFQNILVALLPSCDPSQPPVAQFKLADWGCAFFEGKSGQIRGGVAGTPYYWAPEMVRVDEGKEGAFYGHEVDVFAAGKILEMMSEAWVMPLHLRVLKKGMLMADAKERLAAEEVALRMKEFCGWRWDL